MYWLLVRGIEPFTGFQPWVAYQPHRMVLTPSCSMYGWLPWVELLPSSSDWTQLAPEQPTWSLEICGQLIFPLHCWQEGEHFVCLMVGASSGVGRPSSIFGRCHSSFHGIPAEGYVVKLSPVGRLSELLLKYSCIQSYCLTG